MGAAERKAKAISETPAKGGGGLVETCFSSLDTVLLHPTTGKAFKSRNLWAYISALGRRAGVDHARPHRFRDTFAVDMLIRFNNPYYVANLLGDTMEVVVKHYLPYVRELQERASYTMDNSVGLEQFVTPASQAKI